MADDQQSYRSSDPVLGPDEVAKRAFASSFRGYDQHEVRAFLAHVAAEYRSALNRERHLRERAEEAEARAADDQIGEERITAALGQEAARILQSAREGAAEIKAKAEEQVARLLREAQDEATSQRSEAEGLLAARTAEADEAATVIRRDAEEAAGAELERARAEGRSMVGEAQGLRERVLRDLSRRRRHAEVQLDQLRAGRQRLLDAYQAVQTTVDDATRELTVAEIEARAAAEAAVPVTAQPEPTADELETEAEEARRALPASASRPASSAPESAAARRVTVSIDAAPPPAAPARQAPAPVPRAPLPVPTAAKGGRRSRRKRDAGSAGLPESELLAVQPADEIEGVRLLPPEQSRPPDPEAGPSADGGDHESASAGPDEPGHDEPGHDEPGHDEPGDGTADHEAPRADDVFARLRAARSVEPDASVGHTGDDAGGAVEAVGAAGQDDATEVPVTPAAGAVPDPDEGLRRQRDEVLEGADRAMARALKRVLADDQNAALDRLRRHKGTPTIDDLLPSKEEHLEAYRKAATRSLAQAAELGASSAGAVDGQTHGGDAVADALAAEVVGALRDRLARSLDDSQGGDEQALADGVSASYREWRTQRLEDTGRHHVTAAFAAAAFAATPAGTGLRWVVDDGGESCPDCDDNALAGPVVKGDEFPTGQRHPPAHAGCRCLVVPFTP